MGGYPALGVEAWAGLEVALQAAPTAVGISPANGYRSVVQRLIEIRCGVRLCRSAGTRPFHRPRFAINRPKKRLRKVDEEARAAFVDDYAALPAGAGASGATILFVAEAHPPTDSDLHGKRMLQGQPTLVNFSCPG
jgi:hypothetical protein